MEYMYVCNENFLACCGPRVMFEVRQAATKLCKITVRSGYNTVLKMKRHMNFQLMWIFYLLSPRLNNITDTMDQPQYCLRWNNHGSNLAGCLSRLFQKEALCDVTLVCPQQGKFQVSSTVLFNF